LSLLLVATTTACQAKSPATLTNSAGGPYQGAVVDPPAAKPEFTLVDTQGRKVDFDKATAGVPTLLYFGYTRCPDECPTTMHDLHAALKLVPTAVRDKVKVYFVTTDPKRDTPTVLSHWLQDFDSTFIGLTGSIAQIDAAEAAANVPLASPDPSAQLPNSQGYSVTHASVVLAYDTSNRGPVVYLGATSVDTYAHDIPLLAKES
jgi:protein SCO1/2